MIYNINFLFNFKLDLPYKNYFLDFVIIKLNLVNMNINLNELILKPCKILSSLMRDKDSL